MLGSIARINCALRLKGVFSTQTANLSLRYLFVFIAPSLRTLGAHRAR